MCLIVVKPVGFPMPKDKKLKQWFKDYPDGFGLSFQNGDHVTILKGGMVQRQMFGIIRTMTKLSPLSVKEIAVVMHFRQGTGGGVEPKNCHPFPVTNNQEHLSALSVDTDVALAHNGIIWDYASFKNKRWDLNDNAKTDTQRFIEEIVSGLGKALFNTAVQMLIADYTESKFALLTKDKVYLIGEFVEEKGYLYSNGGYKFSKPVMVYKPSYPPVSGTNFGDYPYLGELPNNACDLCQIVDDNLYYLPDDTDSITCWSCFQNVMGYKPKESDRVRSKLVQNKRRFDDDD